MPPKIVVEDGRQKNHLYTNAEGQNQEKGQEDRKRKVKEQTEGASINESNHEQIESKRKKSKIPEQILSKAELVKCMRITDDGPRTPGIDRNIEGQVLQSKGNRERLAGSIQPSETGDQNSTRAGLSKAKGDKHLEIDRGPQIRIISKFFRSEKQQGQSPATPNQSDKRKGEQIGSTFSFGIPPSIDKEEGPKEPTQQEQES